MPEYIDLLACDRADLTDCDLSEVKGIKFKKGAVVDLRNAKLPEVWDMSYYDNVKFINFNLDGVREIKFRDKAQKKEFNDICNGFKGTIICGDKKVSRIGSKFKYLMIAGAIAGGVAYCSRNGDEKVENNRDTEETVYSNSDENGNENEESSVDFDFVSEKMKKILKIEKYKEEKRQKDKEEREEKNENTERRFGKKRGKKEPTKEETIATLEDMLEDIDKAENQGGNGNVKQNGNGQGKQSGNKKSTSEETIATLEQMLKDMGIEH